jgi:hypothetical protein
MKRGHVLNLIGRLSYRLVLDNLGFVDIVWVEWCIQESTPSVQGCRCLIQNFLSQTRRHRHRRRHRLSYRRDRSSQFERRCGKITLLEFAGAGVFSFQFSRYSYYLFCSSFLRQQFFGWR